MQKSIIAAVGIALPVAKRAVTVPPYQLIKTP